MRKSLILSLAALSALTLGACGKSAPDEAASGGGTAVDPTKTAAEMAFQFQPGQYRTSIDIQKVEIPGMPAAVTNQIKASMGKAISREHCITPEQSARGVEEMKEHLAQGKCQFESFNARGGTVDSVFTCQTGDNMALRASSHGTYTATGSKVATKAQMQGPGGSMVELEQTVTTTRIGNCS